MAGNCKKNDKTRVLVIDDHPMMRQGLAQLINNETDLCVCCEAGSAREAFECMVRGKPNMVLADISLPDKNGLEFIKDLQARHPGTPVLVISMHDESLYAERVLKAGGRGYIMKQEGGKKIMEAIRRVLSGQIYVSDKMSAKILEIFSGRRAETVNSPIEKLTDREFEVFHLIGQGLDSRTIAERLFLSNKTVDVHRAKIKQKLSLKSSAEVARYAIRWVEAEGGM
jgi:DNA-binding NarL/FixJ family response regulator